MNCIIKFVFLRSVKYHGNHSSTMYDDAFPFETGSRGSSMSKFLIAFHSSQLCSRYTRPLAQFKKWYSKLIKYAVESLKRVLYC